MIASEALMNIIHGEVLRVLHRTSRRTPVVVDSYDKETHSAKFKLMPDSGEGNEPVITGWVPLHSLQVGNNYGWHAPPNIGDHGWLEFGDDDREGGNYVGGSFNDQFKPVKTVEAGEWFYKHKSGQSIYFDKDGNVTVTGKKGNEKQTVVLKADGTTHVTDKNGNAIVINGSDTITMTAPKIVLDGTVYLGGADASTPASMKGTIDTNGDADVSNLATKVLVK